MVKETWHYTWTEYIAALLKKADMEYNSAIFFIFLFVFLCVYFLLRSPRIKKRWILAGIAVANPAAMGYNGILLVKSKGPNLPSANKRRFVSEERMFQYG